MHGKCIPVVFVAQLELLLPGENLYPRPKFNHFFAVEMETDIPTYQLYEVEKMVDKRVRKYNKTNVVQYLIKWLKYGPKHNQWKKNSTFDNCIDLAEKYET